MTDLSSETKRRLTQVCNAIRTRPEHFDMSTYIHDCGTPGCIAGYTLAVIAGTNNLHPFLDKAQKTPDAIAADFIGLDNETAHDLFKPEGIYAYWLATENFCSDEMVTADHAVAVIDNLIVTSEVDWSIKS